MKRLAWTVAYTEIERSKGWCQNARARLFARRGILFPLNHSRKPQQPLRVQGFRLFATDGSFRIRPRAKQLLHKAGLETTPDENGNGFAAK